MTAVITPEGGARARAASRLLHRSLRETPPIAIDGHGVWLVAKDGRKILDASGGAAVSCLGHQHPRVIEALVRQASKLAYAHTSFFSSEPAEALAQELVGHEPGGLAYAYFVSGGSEAIEASLKLARQYFLEKGQPQRNRFIARRQSYHGNTLGALAAGGNAWRRAPFAPILSDAFSHVSPAFAYHGTRDGETEADFVRRLTTELDAEFTRLGSDRVAAFIAEPVVGATAGCVTAPGGYFRAVREICNRHGALLILDEVMCGMGRTGTLHAWEQEGIVPDIQAIAKGLGGGYQPIGAMLASARIIDALHNGTGAFQHGHTYLAHPMACAAALEVQKIIKEEGLLDQVRSLGQILEQKLTERFGNHRYVGDIRGRGLFQAIELVEDRTTRRPFDPKLRLHQRIKQAAFNLGLACYPAGGTIDGRSGDHILLAPPYIATTTDIDLIVDRLGGAVEEALGHRPLGSPTP
jgi:adenosylmethionine-8-amino-7-oxononanoate aminotransferase